MLQHLELDSARDEKTLEAKGFTLIELLVVIIILGILAAVAIFAIGSIRTNAEKSACKTEIGTIETAIAAKIAAQPSWDPTAAGLNPITSGSGASQLDNLRKTPKYITHWALINQDGTVNMASSALPSPCRNS